MTTVVNNRADRVPRPKVFASSLVNDISADHHFVIGTNLDRLLSYVRETWQDYIGGVSLQDATFRAHLWTWFERKLVVIEDPHTSGNQIIERIIVLSPPGLFTRVMGLQNIQGTGLDFVSTGRHGKPTTGPATTCITPIARLPNAVCSYRPDFRSTRKKYALRGDRPGHGSSVERSQTVAQRLFDFSEQY